MPKSPEFRGKQKSEGDWDKIQNEGGKGRQRKLQPIDISKIKDQSLEGIEKRLRSLGHEELYVFDKDGNLVAGYKGDATSVAFPMMLLFEEGATVTHGHPKGYEEFGGTFSWADVENMLNSDWAEHRATASGQGEMNYIMRATNNADAHGLIQHINSDIKNVEKNFKETYQKTYVDEIKKGTSAKQASHIARQKGVGVLNAYYKETFPQYGYEYVTRKRNYTYNR